MVKTNPIDEAKRYLSNAKSILKNNAKKYEGQYEDPKYVKMAGNTAYNGILVALDAVVPRPNKGRKSVEHYQKFLAQNDKKLLTSFNNSYGILHLSLGYDGITDAMVVQRGMELADEIIEKVAIKLN